MSYTTCPKNMFFIACISHLSQPSASPPLNELATPQVANQRFNTHVLKEENQYKYFCVNNHQIYESLTAYLLQM